MSKKNSEEKKCWACGRVIVGASKVGLCPECTNKGGSVAGAVALGGIVIGGKFLAKNGKTIAKAAVNIIKNIRV